MGRRSRQRASATPTHEQSTPPRAPATATRPRDDDARRSTAPAPRRSRRDDAPLPPWGSFPLIELCALAAIVLGVWGLIQGGRGGAILLIAAMLLGSVAGLEVAIREHLGGYRSHTLVLSGVLAVATLAGLAFADAERTIMIPGAAAVFATAFVVFRQLFKRRSGGVGVKVR
jgi:hypothetical protein